MKSAGQRHKFSCFRGASSSCLLLMLTLVRSAEHRADGSPPTPPPDPPSSQVPWFASSPIRAKHKKFLRGVIKTLLRDAVFFNEVGSKTGPTRWQNPEALTLAFGSDLTLGEEGTNHKKLLRIIRKVIRFSPKPSHRYMLDARIAGLNPYALAGDFVAATVNGNGALYYLAPVFVLIELQVVRRLGVLFRWPEGEVDGISTAGAGVSNSMAVTLALQAKYPNLKEQGLGGEGVGKGYPTVVLFVSEHSPVPWTKAALYQGVGTRRVVKVRTDPTTGRMDVGHLQARIRATRKNGLVPFMVVGTAGNPTTGAIDPLSSLAAVCKEHGLWFHVDAEMGGGLAFSPRHGAKGRLRGIQHADSVTFSAWMLAAPYVSSLLLVRGPRAPDGQGRLQSAFGTHWHGLFDTLGALYNTSYDTGDSTVQASRRMEIAKLWYAWRGHGDAGLASLVEMQLETAAQLVKEVQVRAKKRWGFRLVYSDQKQPDVPLVPFYYIPKRLRRLVEGSTKFVAAVSAVTTQVRKELLKQNLARLSVASFLGDATMPGFFQVSLTNAVLVPADLRYILDLIAAVAEHVSTNPTEPYNQHREGAPQPPLRDSPEGIPDVNSPIRALHAQFFRDTFALLLDRGIFWHRSDNPFEFMHPEDLEDTKELQLGFPAPRVTHEDLLLEFSVALKLSPHRGHPYFFWQLLGGMDPYTLAADWIASALSTPMISYEESPVFTLMEREVLKALRLRVFGSPSGDGVITDGGSMTNQMAIQLALHTRAPLVRNQGLHGVLGAPSAGAGQQARFVGYMSRDAHYATQKGFILQNLGNTSLVLVNSGARGRMSPKALEAAVLASLAKGDVPFFVCMTTGTTVYGAIDSVASIVRICVKYGLWCHVDGMVGGLLTLSDANRGLLRGVAGVDSFATDLHKLMGATNVGGVLITKRVGLFRAVFGLRKGETSESALPWALYNPEQWDDGRNHWQVDKRNNVFKFWLLWKAKGRRGWEAHVNLNMEHSAYLQQQLRERESLGFQLVIPAYDLTNVCFWYVPSALRTSGLDPNSAEYTERLSAVSYGLEEVLTLNGVMNIVAQQRFLGVGAAFLKFVVMDSAAFTQADVKYLLDALAYWGEHLDSDSLRAKYANVTCRPWI